MLRADLSDGGIAYRDEAGRVADFHSLRHTFITNWARGGVYPKTAQALARHSSITLTIDCYSHSYQGEQRSALASLPDLSDTPGQEIRATGTDDAQPNDFVLADCLAQDERFEATSVGAGGRNAHAAESPEDGHKLQEMADPSNSGEYAAEDSNL